jgi:RNA polymerase subunit RPABC4/transcription elongation factor Spt4
MMVMDLDAIRHQINVGDREGARRELVALLDIDSDNLDAWALLAILLKEPAEQAECYRQILRIDPENRQAAAWLNALRPRLPEAAAQDGPSLAEGRTLECQECGGVTEVRFVGELRDRRVFCPYCGSQIDLSDVSTRVELGREQEQPPEAGIRSLDTLLTKTRRDQVPGEQPPPEAEDIEQVLRELDLPDVGDEVPGQVRPGGPVAGASTEGVRSTRPRKGDRSFLDRLLGRPMTRSEDRELTPDLDRGEEASQSGSLNPEDIIRLAGGPLPEEERRKCPRCGAIVSRSENRCPWCSAQLSAD